MQHPFSLLCEHLLACAVPNVHKFCGIASVRWQFRTQLYKTLPDNVVHFPNCKMSILLNDVVHLLLQCICDDRGSPWSLSVMNIRSPICKQCKPFLDTGRVHNMFPIDCNKSSVNFIGSNVFRQQKSNHFSHLTVGGIWYRRVHCHDPLHSQHEKVRCTNCSMQLSTLYWTHQTTDLVQWNTCAGCMRKRSLLSKQPTYLEYSEYKYVFIICFLIQSRNKSKILFTYNSFIKIKV